MNHPLYFIPLLAGAFKQANRVEALRQSFSEIQHLGGLVDYAGEYARFERFMKAASARPGPDIYLETEGTVLAQIRSDRAAQGFAVGNISPGSYKIRLSTGRSLWAGQLHAEELVWRNAFPALPLQLAADTAGGEQNWTRELRFLEGEMVVRIFAGLERGIIRIWINPQANS